MKEHVIIARILLSVRAGISGMQDEKADRCIAILVTLVFDTEEIRIRYVPNIGLTRLYILSLRFIAIWSCTGAVIKRRFVYTNKFHYKFDVRLTSEW
jgi:hypothetical protein